MATQSITIDKMQERLRVIYAAVKQTNALPLGPQHVLIQELLAPGTDRVIGYKWDFNIALSDEEAWLLAMGSVRSISTFHQYARPYAETNGIPVVEVETVAKNCRAIRICRDLDVIEKHPKDWPNSSGVNPRIKNFRRYPVLGDGGTITYNFFGSKGPSVSANNASIALNADIVNEKTGAVVTDLQTTLGEALVAWESFLRTHKII